MKNQIDHQNQICVGEVQKLGGEKRFWFLRKISLSPSKFRIECVQSHVGRKVAISSDFWIVGPQRRGVGTHGDKKIKFKDVPFPWIEDSICEIIKFFYWVRNNNWNIWVWDLQFAMLLNMSRTLFLVLLSLTLSSLCVESKLAHSKAQNRKLQKVIRHKRVTIVLDGVRQRLTTVSPDALVLINFPEIDHQFKVSVLTVASCLK